jgi:hypothetical protein
MKLIKINEKEFSYLMSSNFICNELLYLIRKSIQKNGCDHILKITEDNADKFRDLFGEQLQVVGFQKNYQLTEEGEILEELIDKFF